MNDELMKDENKTNEMSRNAMNRIKLCIIGCSFTIK